MFVRNAMRPGGQNREHPSAACHRRLDQGLASSPQTRALLKELAIKRRLFEMDFGNIET